MVSRSLLSVSFSVAAPAHLLALAAWLRLAIRPAGVPSLRRPAAAGDWPTAGDAGALLASPLLLAWGLLAAGAQEHAAMRRPGWASLVLAGLAVAVAAGAVAFAVRWRRRWAVAVPCALAVRAGAPYAWFIAAMAITNRWL